MNLVHHLIRWISTLSFGILAIVVQTTTISAQEQHRTLRVQTHFGSDTTSGKLASEFADDVQTMSAGELKIELHFSSGVVKPHEAFTAAAAGIIDGDMSSPSYQVANDPAFQVVANTFGIYDTAYQQHAWFYNGGMELVQKLYNKHGMHLVGCWTAGGESLSSSKPLPGIGSLKDWRFRSPPGLQSQIFEKLGAIPVAMDFSSIFEALKNKTIEGTDASGLANNRNLGLYNIAQHATHPGFHSMPADHLAINKSKWDALPAHLQRIVSVAMETLAFKTAVNFEAKNQQAAAQLANSGVTLHNWSELDRKAYRTQALVAWESFAEASAQTQALIDSHRTFMQSLGLVDPP